MVTNVDWAPNLNLTVPNDLKSQNKAERSQPRDERRRKRTKLASIELNSTVSSFVSLEDNSGTILHEMSSSFSDTNFPEITFPVAGEYQTDEVICINCKKNPFISQNLKKISDSSSQTEQDLIKELDMYKQDNAYLRKEVEYYKKSALKQHL